MTTTERIALENIKQWNLDNKGMYPVLYDVIHRVARVIEAQLVYDNLIVKELFPDAFGEEDF